MLHHYGSSLNSLPMIDAFLQPPTADNAPAAADAAPASFHDLRIGYGGHMGVLTNIHRDGFGSMGFHAWPETLAWDGYSGDFGAGYLGHVVGSVCVLVLHEGWGWLGFGGNVEEIQEEEGEGGGEGEKGGGMVGGVKVKVQPKDTVRRKIYVAPMGAKIEISAGVIREFVYYHYHHHHHHNATKETKETKEHNATKEKKEHKNKLILELNRVAGENASQAILKVEDTLGMGIKLKTRGLRNVRGGGYLVDLPGWVEIGL